MIEYSSLEIFRFQFPYYFVNSNLSNQILWTKRPPLLSPYSGVRPLAHRGGAGAAGGERGRRGHGLGLQPVRRVGAAGLVGARAVVAALAHVGWRGGRAAAAAAAVAQGAQRRAACRCRLLAPRSTSAPRM